MCVQAEVGSLRSRLDHLQSMQKEAIGSLEERMKDQMEDISQLVTEKIKVTVSLANRNRTFLVFKFRKLSTLALHEHLIQT